MKMKTTITITLLGVCVLAGCDIDSETNVCKYNAQIVNNYLFVEDDRCIHRVSDYLFDSGGVLVQTSDRNKNSLHQCEFNLKEGDYTLVSWANIGRVSVVTPEVVGKTRLQEMLISVDATSKYSGYNQNSEKLYFGVLKFSVDQAGITHTSLLMRRAYASLKMTVKWAQVDEIPVNRDALNIRLRQIRGNYPLGNPFSLTDIKNVNYAVPATMNDQGEIEGELVSYRYTHKVQQLFQLYNGDVPITGEIDLTPLFEKLNLNMDMALRQNFKGSTEINGNKVLIILNEELETPL